MRHQHSDGSFMRKIDQVIKKKQFVRGVLYHARRNTFHGKVTNYMC